MIRFPRLRRLALYTFGGLAGVVLLLGFATCSTEDPQAGACPTPEPGSAAAGALANVRSAAGFDVLYPCQLPGAERIETATISGPAGRHRVELFFDGPFEMAIRQSQFPPPFTPAPTGASRVTIDLFPNVRAILLEVNDGTSKAEYHLFWEQSGLFYEIQALGPPLQRRTILLIARSLQ